MNKGDAVVERSKRELGMSLDAELAEWFGVDPAAVHWWRKRGLPHRRTAELQVYHLTGKKPNGKRARA